MDVRSALLREGQDEFEQRYTLDRLIGVGVHTTTVWTAWDAFTGRSVAVKLLPPAEDATTADFLAGARASSILMHPFIAETTDFGRSNDEHFMVMECLDVPTLADVLAEETVLAPRRAIALADKLLEGVVRAHAAGVVHGALDPGAIYIVERGRTREHVKAARFGMGRFYTSARSLTDSDDPLSALAFRPPEVRRGAPPDERADVYAVGALLFAALLGQAPPLTGAIGGGIVRRLFATLGTIGLHQRLTPMILRALAVDRRRRFCNVSALRAALLVPGQVRPTPHLRPAANASPARA